MPANFTKKGTTRSGFTLIELLVVIGVIAVLAGAIGVGFSRGNQATDLASARQILRTHLIAARQQAALSQSNAALIVAADATDSDRYLRYVAVAVREETSGEWRVSAGGATLPGEVWVMPPVSGSSLLSESVAVALDPGGTAGDCYLLRFGANGQVLGDASGEIWVSVGVREASGLSFDNDAPRAGLAISRYGAVSNLDSTEVSDSP